MTQLAPAVREQVILTIRGTVDLLLASATDADLYQMLAGLSGLAYQAITEHQASEQHQHQAGPAGPQPGQVPQGNLVAMPHNGQYL